MNINTKSWHYRLFSVYTDTDTRMKREKVTQIGLCDYIKAVFFLE